MKRFRITIENSGRIAVVLALGAMAAVLCFLLWAALERGGQ